MAQLFSLQVTSVECLNANERKDEMYIVGFGLTGSGTTFTMGPASLGRFDTGRKTPVGYSRPLAEIAVGHNDGVVATCFWLFEHDQAALRRKHDELNSLYAAAYGRELSNGGAWGDDVRGRLYSFARAMMTMRAELAFFAVDRGVLGDDDELLEYGRFFHHYPNVATPFDGGRSAVVGTFSLRGIYTLTFETVFNVEPVVEA